ncbi:MAG: hypothetical protein ACFCD0_02700 [Gemmataceae bacterium]
MRKSRLQFVFLVSLLSTCSGCGTLFNLQGQEPWLLGIPPEREIVPFGGIDNDIRVMSRGLPPEELNPLPIVVGAIDMPLSFVGDVLTLPWTTYHWMSAEQANSKVNDHPQVRDPSGSPAVASDNDTANENWMKTAPTTRQ